MPPGVILCSFQDWLKGVDKEQNSWEVNENDAPAVVLRKGFVEDEAVSERKVIILLIGHQDPGMENVDLGGPGYSVIEAQDVEGGVQQYFDHKPSIVILNMNSAREDRSDFIRYVRENANDPDTYILALLTSDVLGPETLTTGANDYLAIPFSSLQLAAQMTVAFRQLRLNNQLRHAYDRISAELAAVDSIQRKLLPSKPLALGNIEIKSLYRPSGQASGDYYDYFLLKNNSLRVVVADVSGHGGRAALIMAVVRTLFRTSQEMVLDLEKTMVMLNEHLCEIIGDESDFVTVFAADILMDRGVLNYVSAGHCPALLKNGSIITRLEPTAPVLGFFPLELKATEVAYGEGASLLCYTDGLYEWEVAPGEQLGLDRFLDAASEVLSSDRYVLDWLLAKIESLSELRPEFRDDLTALWVKL